MKKRHHDAEIVTSIKEELGAVRHVEASADNRAVVLLHELEGQELAVVFNDRVVAEVGPADPLRFSLSFDGTKLAVGRKRKGCGDETIAINGEPAYAVECDTLYHLHWLDSERLAWEAWQQENGQGRILPDGRRTFVNGEDRTGEIEIEPVWADRMRHQVIVREGERVYVVADDGSRSEPETVEPGTRLSDWMFGRARFRPEGAPEIRTGTRGGQYVVWRGGPHGPVFDGIETGGGLRTFAQSDDGSRLAYIGIRYGKVAKAMSRTVGGALERVEDEPTGLSKLWAWPMALLFNPYFGPGHAYIESSKRYYPVNGRTPWRRGYRYAHDHFFTPDGRLVVTCIDDTGTKVVIDEDEGPPCREVYNVRHVPGEGVCYLARRHHDLYRVVVR